MRRDRRPLPRAFARAVPSRRPTPATSSPRSTARPTRGRRLAGRAPATPTPECSPDNAGRSSSPRRPATRRSASPSSSSSTRPARPGIETPSRRRSRTSGSTSRSASASTRRRPRSATLATFTANALACPPTSVVGASLITAAARGPAAGAAGARPRSTTSSPTQGEPALFGFSAVGSNVFLKSDVEWSGDYHEGFTIAVPEAPLGTQILKNRLVFTGVAGNGTFLTNPEHLPRPRPGGLRRTPTRPSCGPTRSEARTRPSPAARPRSRRRCRPGSNRPAATSVPFKPGDRERPRAPTRPTRPPAPQVEVTRPLRTGAADRQLQRADGDARRLPLGMGLNPSAADGLVVLQRRPARQGHAQRRRLPGQHRRSAPSPSRPRRCRPAR